MTSMNDSPVLELDRVSKQFGQFTAVDDVSLQIPKGAVYGFLGPNGAGKTTTIRMMLNITKPTSGGITILGASNALKVRRRIGFLPEEKGLYKSMKAAAVIQYLAMLKGLSRRAARQRARQLLQRYGLGDFMDAKVETLSKGMAQKVQVLATVAHDPELVIFDEPFSGLDPVNQAVLEELISDLAERGRTVIFSTHIMQHAERLCGQILLIAGGRKVFDGSVSAAKATIPRRVTLGTLDDGRGDGAAKIEALRTAPGVREVVAMPDADDADGAAPRSRWQVQIDEKADPQSILQRCFEQGISLSSFEINEPSLHDVFIHLVGPDAAQTN